MYKILVADDHPLFRDAVINIISQTFPESEIFESKDIESTLTMAKEITDIDQFSLNESLGEEHYSSGMKLWISHFYKTYIMVEENLSEI